MKKLRYHFEGEIPLDGDDDPEAFATLGPEELLMMSATCFMHTEVVDDDA